MIDVSLTDVRLVGGLTGVRCDPPAPTGKKPILLCHGRMAGAWQWARLQPFLARRGYPSLAVNYRGHCDSTPVFDLSGIRFADLLDDVTRAARSMGAPIAIGQSTGGLLVQKLAEADVVAAAVLACSIPPAGIAWGSRRSATEVPRVDPDVRYRIVAPDRADFDEHVYNRMPGNLADEAFVQQVAESGRLIVELLNQQVEVDETKVKCPVLSVVAGDDRQVAPDTGLAVAAKYGGLAVVRPHAGHYALVYEPAWEETADLVVDWLDRVVARAL